MSMQLGRRLEARSHRLQMIARQERSWSSNAASPGRGKPGGASGGRADSLREAAPHPRCRPAARPVGNRLKQQVGVLKRGKSLENPPADQLLRFPQSTVAHCPRTIGIRQTSRCRWERPASEPAGHLQIAESWPDRDSERSVRFPEPFSPLLPGRSPGARPDQPDARPCTAGAATEVMPRTGEQRKPDGLRHCQIAEDKLSLRRRRPLADAHRRGADHLVHRDQLDRGRKTTPPQIAALHPLLPAAIEALPTAVDTRA